MTKQLLKVFIVSLGLITFFSSNAQQQASQIKTKSAQISRNLENDTQTSNLRIPSADGDILGYGFSVWQSNSIAKKFFSFQIENPGSFFVIKEITTPIIAAEYFDGYVYAYSQNTSNYNIRFHKIDYKTGNMLQDIEVESAVPISGISYDYTTQTMYGTEGKNIYKVNLATGVTTQVGNLNLTTHVFAYCFSIDKNGNIFFIAKDNETGRGYLYSYNLTTQANTLIGDTNIATSYRQSMAFERSTNTLYWGNCNDNDGKLYKVDTQNGTCTDLGDFEGKAEVVGLFFVKEGAVAINEMEISNYILSPNPANSVLNINGKDVKKINIYNVEGKLIATHANTQSVDVSTYYDGIYFIEIISQNNQVSINKFIVKK